MGLADSAKKLVKTYSGGMMRRLELAQAMLHRPTILFLDEPTIGLDPMARHSVWDRLRDLRHDYGMTVLITTHDMEEAEALCDELAILHAGQVAVVGNTGRTARGAGRRRDAWTRCSLTMPAAASSETGNFRDAVQTRRTAQRLG